MTTISFEDWLQLGAIIDLPFDSQAPKRMIERNIGLFRPTTALPFKHCPDTEYQRLLMTTPPSTLPIDPNKFQTFYELLGMTRSPLGAFVDIGQEADKTWMITRDGRIRPEMLAEWHFLVDDLDGFVSVLNEHEAALHHMLTADFPLAVHNVPDAPDIDKARHIARTVAARKAALTVIDDIAAEVFGNVASNANEGFRP